MVNDSLRLQLTVRRANAGMTLIELMVALAIGVFLMIGAMTVFMQGRTTFRVTESISRLQETARFALDVLEPDVRMAGYFGLTNVPTNIEGRAGTTVPAGVPATCGATWIIDFERPVTATNGASPWPWGATCDGTAPVETNADTLVVRRVAEDPATTLAANTLYIQSNRSEKSQLFVGTDLPASPNPTTSQPHRVIVNGYYVSRENTSNLSTVDGAIPSLRMRTLEGDSVIRDREILPGVEDLQVQLGIDTSLPKTPGRGTIDRFVDPGDALLNNPGFRDNERLILAVRIWVRVRAERTERGFTDEATYSYAGQNFGPFNDGYRRAVVSKTIYLRNGNLR